MKHKRVIMSITVILMMVLTLIPIECFAASSPVVKITGATYPTTITEGKDFTMKGKISSTKTITYVYIGILDSKGKWINTKLNRYSTSNSSKSFDIYKKANSKVKFNNLKRGTYYYYCKVKTGGVYKQVFKKKFTVACNHNDYKLEVTNKACAVNDSYGNYIKSGDVIYMAQGDVYGSSKSVSITKEYSFSLSAGISIKLVDVASAFGYKETRTETTSTIVAKTNTKSKAYYFAPYERKSWRVYTFTEKKTCKKCQKVISTKSGKLYAPNIPGDSESHNDPQRYRWGRSSTKSDFTNTAKPNASIFSDYK